MIGGTAATENQYPWICSILRSDFTVIIFLIKIIILVVVLIIIIIRTILLIIIFHQFYGCAATLLSCFPQVIIVSAAHCFARCP